MMLLIISVRVQYSWCMGLGLVVLLVVMWLVVSDMTIHDGFFDVLACMLHVLYIYSLVSKIIK
jgi:hypothetical protein